MEGQLGDEWLVGGLMSKVQDRYGAEVAKTLGWLALLHAVLDEDDEGVPTCVRDRVLSSYGQVKMLEDGEQAISMVPLNVYRIDESLVVSDLLATNINGEAEAALLENVGNTRVGGAGAVDPASVAAINGVLSQMRSLNTKVTELQHTMAREHQDMK